MYPIAFGFIDSETEDNWIWFMSQLNKAIGNAYPLAICMLVKVWKMQLNKYSLKLNIGNALDT